MRARRFHLSWNQMRHTVRIASQRRILDLVAFGRVAVVRATALNAPRMGPPALDNRSPSEWGLGGDCLGGVIDKLGHQGASVSEP